MSVAVRRETRKRARAAHIAELENAVGFSPSYDASGLPTVVIIRNPKGEWFMMDRWVSRGLDPYSTFHFDEVRAATKRGCIRKVRRRFRAMVEADLVGETKVTL